MQMLTASGIFSNKSILVCTSFYPNTVKKSSYFYNSNAKVILNTISQNFLRNSNVTSETEKTENRIKTLVLMYFS